MIRLSEDIKKLWIKATLKNIKILSNNRTFLVHDIEKGEPVTSYRDVYKAKIQSDGSFDKLRLIIVVGGFVHNKELVGYTCSPTASIINLKYFLEDAIKHKTRVHQLDFIGSFLETTFKNKVFVKLDSRYADYFQEYSS